MAFLSASVGTILLFAGQVGFGALSDAGWVPAVLPACAVLAVWLGKETWVAYAVGPAAVFVDLMYAQQLPLATVSVLCSFGVATIIQRRWLTNHSSMSLIGITIAGLAVAHGAHLTLQSFAYASGVLSSDVHEAWAGWSSLRLYMLECTVTIALGITIRAILRSVSRRFIYASR